MARQAAPVPQARTASFAEHKRSMILVADQYVKGFDRDGDGLLTVAEATWVGADDFAKGDTNHDGKLSLAEVIAATDFKGTYKWFQGRAGELFQQIDLNHDGNLTFEEFRFDKWSSPAHNTPAQRAIPFGLGDRNRDGKLTYGEFENALAWMFSKAALEYLPSPGPTAIPSLPPTPDRPALPLTPAARSAGLSRP